MTAAAVELHWFDVDTVTSPALTDAERARAAHMRSEPARRRFVARRTALRRLLGDRLGIDPCSVELTAGPHGKPAVRAPGGPHFNVSSSGRVVVIAVSDRADMGVDVEHVRDRVRREAIARRFFTRAEQAHAASLDGFFTVWTLKEAVVKATGLGLSHLPLDRFDVDPTVPAGTSALVASDADPAMVDAWHLGVIDAPPGYRAALATRAP